MFKQINNLFQKQNFFTYNKKTKKDDSKTKTFLNDFCEIDDFEDLSKEPLEQSINQNNNINDKNKEFLNEFSKTIITTILDARMDKKNCNIINTSKNNSENSEEYDNKSFSFDINELFLYDDFYQEKNEIQKFIIEFYLIKCKNNKKINQLVEKWKISYKIKEDNGKYNSFDENSLKNKILVLQKSIISYSRLLPLYQYIKSNKDNSDYSINFKFYQNNSKKNGEFINKPSGNVSLKNQNLLSFKMNIEYYSEKEIKNIFNETEDELNRKKKSLSFTKKKPSLDEFKIKKDEINNPINTSINDYISKVKTYPTKENNKIKDIDSLSDSSSLILNIYDNDNEAERKEIIKLSKKIENNQNENNIKDKEENTCKRKCSMFSDGCETEECTSRNNDSKINDNKGIKSSPTIDKKIIKNKNINNIIKEYSLLKDMIQSYNSNIVSKNKKLITYMDVFE